MSSLVAGPDLPCELDFEEFPSSLEVLLELQLDKAIPISNNGEASKAKKRGLKDLKG